MSLYHACVDELNRVVDQRELEHQTGGDSDTQDKLLAREVVHRDGAFFRKENVNTRHGLSPMDLAISNTPHGLCWQLETSVAKPKGLDADEWFQTTIGGRDLWARRQLLPLTVTGLYDAIDDEIEASSEASVLQKYRAMDFDDLLGRYPSNQRKPMVISDSAYFSTEVSFVADATEDDTLFYVRVFDAYRTAKLKGKKASAGIRRILREIRDESGVQLGHLEALFRQKAEVFAERRKIMGLQDESRLESYAAPVEQPVHWGLPKAVFEAAADKAEWEKLKAEGWYVHPQGLPTHAKGRVAKEAIHILPTREFLANFALEQGINLRRLMGWKKVDMPCFPEAGEISTIMLAVQADFELKQEEMEETTDASAAWTNMSDIITEVVAPVQTTSDIRPKPSVGGPEPVFAGAHREYIESRLRVLSTPDEVVQWSGDTGPLVSELAWLRKKLRDGSFANVGHPLADQLQQLYDQTNWLNEEGRRECLMLRMPANPPTVLYNGENGLAQAIMLNKAKGATYEEHLADNGEFGIFMPSFTEDGELIPSDFSRPSWHKVKVVRPKPDADPFVFKFKFFTKNEKLNKWILINPKHPLLDLFPNRKELPKELEFASYPHYLAECLRMTKVDCVKVAATGPVIVQRYAKDVFPAACRWAFHMADLWMGGTENLSDYYRGDEDLMLSIYQELSAFQAASMKRLTNFALKKVASPLLGQIKQMIEDVCLDPSAAWSRNYEDAWGQLVTPYRALLGAGSGLLWQTLGELQGSDSKIALPREVWSSTAKLSTALGYKSCSDYPNRKPSYFQRMVMADIYRTSSIDRRRWTLSDGTVKWMPPLNRWGNWTSPDSCGPRRWSYMEFGETSLALDANPLNFGSGALGDSITKLMNVLYPVDMPGLKGLTRPSPEAYLKTKKAALAGGYRWRLDMALRVHAANLFAKRHPETISRAMKVATNWGGVKYLQGRDNTLVASVFSRVLFPAPTRKNLVVSQVNLAPDTSNNAVLLTEDQLDEVFGILAKGWKQKRQRARLGRALLGAVDQKAAMALIRLQVAKKAAASEEVAAQRQARIDDIIEAHLANLGSLPKQLKFI